MEKSPAKLVYCCPLFSLLWFWCLCTHVHAEKMTLAFIKLTLYPAWLSLKKVAWLHQGGKEGWLHECRAEFYRTSGKPRPLVVTL